MIFRRLLTFAWRIRQIGHLYQEVERLSDLVGRLEERLDAATSRADLPDTILREFTEDRLTEAYNAVFTKEEPLVTVCIGTYNRAKILTERALSSVIAQSYKNLEIIVVGDCCTDDTEAAIRALGDSRVTFINLPVRGDYPVEKALRWYVAGTSTVNHALSLARGDFITHLDDDDEFVPERIEGLLRFIQTSRVDFVWHPFWYESDQGEWLVNDASEFRMGRVTTSAIFYHRWFARIPWDPGAYRYHEPGDWNRFRKIRYLGARTLRFDAPLVRHYRERNQ